MYLLQDRRIRILLIVVLLLIGVIAAYQVIISYWSSQHYSAALAALGRYDYEEAAAHLKNYLAFRPNDPNVLFLASQTARRRGSGQEAVELMILAERNGHLKVAIDRERKLQVIQNGDLSGAPLLLEFCKGTPELAESALSLEAIIEGSLKMRHADLCDEAVDFWLKHRPSKIDQAQGLVWRGRSSLVFDRNVPLPQDDFRDAIKLAPDHFQARLYLAAGLIGQEPMQAIPHLEWLRQHRPDDLNVRFQLARFHSNMGQPEEAGRLLDDLIARTQQNRLGALVERAKVAMDLHRPQEAEKYLLQAHSIDPERREIREIIVAMAECLRQMNRLDEAEKYLDRVRDFDAAQQKKLKDGGKDKK